MRFGFHHGQHRRGQDPRDAMRGGRGFGGGRHGGATFWGEDGVRGARRRVFDGGELRLVLLRLIGDEPRHGYDLIRAIETRTGGAYAPSPGVVYPTLTLLGDMGQIAEQPDASARKIFAVTAEGTRLLDEKAAEIAELMARLDALGVVQERTDGGSVRRAMHNLKAVLVNRLGGEDVERETLHEIVALIDEAARKIERL